MLTAIPLREELKLISWMDQIKDSHFIPNKNFWIITNGQLYPARYITVLYLSTQLFTNEDACNDYAITTQK